MLRFGVWFARQAEKPDMMLAVMCASLHIADQTVYRSYQAFDNSLER